MFTGIVEAIGTLVEVAGDAPRRLTLETTLPLADVHLGDSVAVDGCCLTVADKSATSLTFQAVAETLQRTTLGTLAVGARVNLERALRYGDRLGGHLVAGHVDGVGLVHALQERSPGWTMQVEAPAEMACWLAPRGSVTISGVSLTIAEVALRVFAVALIPHTLKATTLQDLKVGSAVNLEADMVARYIDRLLQTRYGKGSDHGI